VQVWPRAYCGMKPGLLAASERPMAVMRMRFMVGDSGRGLEPELAGTAGEPTGGTTDGVVPKFQMPERSPGLPSSRNRANASNRSWAEEKQGGGA
jgi:hypothetical protein